MGVRLIDDAEVSLLDRDVQVGVAPSFGFVEGPEDSYFKRLCIVDVCEVTSVPQLKFKEVVVAIKLAFNRKIRFYARHFTHRLHIVHLEGCVVCVRCHVLEDVPIVRQCRARYHGYMSFVALKNHGRDLLQVTRKDSKRVCLL